MRRLTMVVALGLAAPAVAHADDHGVVLDRVVLVINDVPVFASQLDRRSAQAAGDAAPNPASRAAAEAQLIDEALIAAAARDLSVTVTAEEVGLAIDSIKANNQLDDAGLLAALDDVGFTLDEYREDIHRELRALRTRNYLSIGQDAAFARWQTEQRKRAYIERPVAP